MLCTAFSSTSLESTTTGLHTLVQIMKHTPLPSQLTDQAYEHVPKENLHTLYGYSDAAWAMDIRQCRSISGILFFLSGAVAAWKTCVQPTVALSTASSDFLWQATLIALVSSSVRLSTNSFNINMQQRPCTKKTMRVEWLKIKQRPINRCIISQFVISRCKTGQK
jgi:hypothetical protein